MAHPTTTQASNPPSPKFPLGQTVATPGAIEAMAAAGVSPFDLFRRHQSGDWGDVPPEDAKANEFDLTHEGRLISSYRLPTGVTVWVITENDRSATTVLLPGEY